MNDFYRVIIVSFLLILGGSMSIADTNDVEMEAVRAVTESYIKGTYEGDTELLQSVFHASAVMNGYLGDQLVMAGPEPFIQQIGSGPSLKSAGAPYEASIDYIDVLGNVGSVTLRESGLGDHDFVNYLHFLKSEGEWKIVSKNFTTK